MRLILVITLTTLLQAQTPKPLAFDVATIKPADPNARGGMLQIQPNNGIKIANLTVKQVLAFARNVREAQILGGPPWIATEKFNFEGKNEPSGPTPDLKTLSDEQRKEIRRQLEQRLGSLLADRFQLIVKEESREMPVYALVQAKGGSKLTPSKAIDPRPMFRGSRAAMEATHVGIEMLTQSLSLQGDRPVIDKTGLTGYFDFKLEWTPDPPPGATAPELSGPSLFTALQEQLGLKLEPQKAMIPVLIIERAEKPSAN